MSTPIRVLVVDDSALMRKLVTEMVLLGADMEVIGQARDGIDALAKIEKLRPDVVTLDVEMPNMDGLQTLTEIMKRGPLPVVMLSSLTQAGARTTLECLSKGAVDFVGKPSGSISLDISSVAQELVSKIRSAFLSRPHALLPVSAPVASARSEPSPSMKGCEPVASIGKRHAHGRLSLVVVGSSTGGPRALQEIIPALPGGLGVPVVVVQHMPPNFTLSLANRLNEISPLTVKEVAEGDKLQAGVVLIAKGGQHLEFDSRGTAHLSDAPTIHGVRPSIDVTLASLVPHFGPRTLSVLLTGMGKDGASGLKAVRTAGGFTIAEDESTCVVFGMPKAARDIDAVDEWDPLHEIAAAITRHTASIAAPHWAA